MFNIENIVLRKLETLSQQKKNLKALDLGCGEGYWTIKLAELGFFVDAVDNGKRQPPVEIYGDIDLLNYLFRDQSNNPDYTIHYWAYDESSLKNLLSFVGFRKVVRRRFNPRYCNPKRRFYTLYIKTIK